MIFPDGALQRHVHDLLNPGPPTGISSWKEIQFPRLSASLARPNNVICENHCKKQDKTLFCWPRDCEMSRRQPARDVPASFLLPRDDYLHLNDTAGVFALQQYIQQSSPGCPSGIWIIMSYGTGVEGIRMMISTCVFVKLPRRAFEECIPNAIEVGVDSRVTASLHYFDKLSVSDPHLGIPIVIVFHKRQGVPSP